MVSVAGRLRADEPVRVACVGNSITQGSGLSNQWQDSYPGVLRQMLGRGYDVRNFGYSSRTALKRGDYPYLRERMMADAVAFRPDIVTIKLGTNDSKPWNWAYRADFEKDLSEVVESFRSPDRQPQIYLCLPVPAFASPWGIDSAVIRREVVPAVRRVAQKLGVHLVDLNTPLKPYGSDFPDGIHPNAQGAARIAAVLYEALTGRPAPDYRAGQPFPGRQTTWQGFARYDFVYTGRGATVVAPRKAAPGRPWVWRADSAATLTAADRALLERGYHVAFYDLADLYGNPRAVQLGGDFYRTLCNYYGFAQRVALEGAGPGALFAFNWAAQTAGRVACLYAARPVSDVDSWPRRADAARWTALLAAWGTADAQADTTFTRMALRAVPALTRAGVPLLAVCGKSDSVAPFARNMQPVCDAYEAKGGVVELVLTDSAADPGVVADFVCRHQPGFADRQCVTLRGGVERAARRFREERKGCVAFLDDSGPARGAWRDGVKAYLGRRFPDTAFTFIEADAGPGSSVARAARFGADVLDHGTPDLLIVSTAVADDSLSLSAEEQVRGMESIVRQALTANAATDIVMLYRDCAPFQAELAAGRQPDVIMNHERVANRYGLASVNSARELADRTAAGEPVCATTAVQACYTAALVRLFESKARGAVAKGRTEALPAPLDCGSDKQAKRIRRAKEQAARRAGTASRPIR